MNKVNKEQSTEKVESKKCMMYIRNIKTESFEIFRWQCIKLSDTEINKMHEEIGKIYPEINQWIVPVPSKIKCNC